MIILFIKQGKQNDFNNQTYNDTTKLVELLIQLLGDKSNEVNELTYNILINIIKID
jgi:hypothetical protein